MDIEKQIDVLMLRWANANDGTEMRTIFRELLNKINELEGNNK